MILSVERNKKFLVGGLSFVLLTQSSVVDIFSSAEGIEMLSELHFVVAGPALHLVLSIKKCWSPIGYKASWETAT